MSDVLEAKPGDIYVDSNGKLWRCLLTCREPMVTFEEVEGRVQYPNYANLAGAQQTTVWPPPPPPLVRDRKSGGIGGLMWHGWRRIFRPKVSV